MARTATLGGLAHLGDVEVERDSNDSFTPRDAVADEGEKKRVSYTEQKGRAQAENNPDVQRQWPGTVNPRQMTHTEAKEWRQAKTGSMDSKLDLLLSAGYIPHHILARVLNIDRYVRKSEHSRKDGDGALTALHGIVTDLVQEVRKGHAELKLAVAGAHVRPLGDRVTGQVMLSMT
jgi:hypothetical protein